MIGWLLLGLALASDPTALRQLHGEPAAAVDVGSEGLSVAADVGPLVGVHWRPDTWIGAAVGQSAALTGKDRPWGIDGTVAAGVGGLLATPGVALTLTGAVRGGVRNDRGLATLGLVVPAAVGSWPVRVAVPLALEPTVGIHLGPAWLGMRGQAGATLVPGSPPALRAGWSGWVRVPLASGRKAGERPPPPPPRDRRS